MLPNLGALVSDWHYEQITVVPDAAGWVPLLPADPLRWFFSVACVLGSNITIGTVLDTLGEIGLPMLPFSIIEIEYKKYGPMCGQEWFVHGRGTTNPVTVFWASITR